MRPSAPLAFAALLALAACAPGKAPEAPAAAPAPAPAPTAGMANPASVACVNDGGKLKIYDTPQGQIGICTTKQGQVCEEWGLFRDHVCNPIPADATLAPGQEG